MPKQNFAEFLKDFMEVLSEMEEESKEKSKEEEEDIPEGVPMDDGMCTFAQVLAAFEVDIEKNLPVTLWARHVDMPENVFLTYKYEVGWDEKGNQFTYPIIILGSNTDEDPVFNLEDYLLGYGWYVYRDDEDDEDKE